MKTIEKHVELTEAERARLIKVTNTGTAKEILYANIILMCSRKQAPVHGSWLNIAEIELSVMERQCLKRRIPDIETLRTELAAWHTARNENQKTVDWQFTTTDARIKLKRLYPCVVN